VLILWAWTVLLSGFILFPLYISSVNAFIPFGVLALGVILYTLFHPSLRRQTEPGPEGEAPLDPPDDPRDDASGADPGPVGKGAGHGTRGAGNGAGMPVDQPVAAPVGQPVGHADLPTSPPGGTPVPATTAAPTGER
jgi:hypothetical protein